jgi:hypothetical protein
MARPTYPPTYTGAVPPRARTAAVPLLPPLAVALTLGFAGCTGAGVMGPAGRPGPGASQELGPHAVQRALLDRDDVGGPFVEVDNDSHDSGVDAYRANLGCVTALDVLDNKANDPADAARTFSVGEAAVATVSTAVISYRSAELADQAMDDLARGLERCAPVDVEDENGHWELEPETDEMGWAGGDRQTNIAMTGTVADANTRTRIALEASAVRVAQSVVYVVLMDTTDDLRDHPRDLTDAAVARLRAVTAGEDPPGSRPLMETYEPGSVGVTA